MWLTIVLELHLLPGSNLEIRFNALSPGFAFQQRELYNFSAGILWKNFYSARIKFSPRMLSTFCFPAEFSPDPGEDFFLGGIPASRDFSARFLPRYTRREFFPGRIPPGKRATRAGSRQHPGERLETWQGNIKEK